MENYRVDLGVVKYDIREYAALLDRDESARA